MYLLDTNTLIYFFKGKGRVPERFLATAPGEITISTITVFEIETGIAKSNQLVPYQVCHAQGKMTKATAEVQSGSARPQIICQDFFRRMNNPPQWIVERVRKPPGTNKRLFLF